MGLLGVNIAKSNARGELVFESVAADAETLAEIADSSELKATFVSVDGTPADGDAIVWDDIAGEWVPAPVEGGGALSILPEAEGDAGTATTARSISAERLKQQIEQHGITVIPGAVVRGVIVETGTEARPAGADVVIWVDPDNLGAVNALSTDPVINSAGGGGGGVSLSPLMVPPVSTMWAASPVINSNQGSDSGFHTLNTLWLCPIYIRADGDVDKVSFRTLEPGAADGRVVRAGIWAADGNYRPTGAPLAAVTVDTTGGGDTRWETALGATVGVVAPIFFVGLVQQVATSYILQAPVTSGLGYFYAEDDGYILNRDQGGVRIPDAYTVTGVTGALPDLTSATLIPAVSAMPRHAVRFA